MMKQFASVDEYIASFPKDVQRMLKDLRKTIKTAAPGAIEKISYGMPGYKLYDRRLVYFGGFKNHVSLFPASGSATEAFKDELKAYETSKGTVRFPLDKPLPLSLIRRIVEFRAGENLERTKK